MAPPAVLSSGGSSSYNEMAAGQMLIAALARQGVEVDQTAHTLPAAERAEMPAELMDYAGIYGDSSSAAIVACGLLEAAKYAAPAEAESWRTLARQMLAALADGYAVQPGTLGAGQLLHGTYSKKNPYNTCTPEGVDECTSWGDYFYMEALTRLTKDWEMYW